MPNSPMGQISERIRAERAWVRINRKPTEVSFIRNGEALDPQTVRIEFSSGGSNSTDAGVTTVGVQSVVIFGVKGHPRIPDTNVQRNDRLVLNDEEYTIEAVNANQPGEKQAVGIVRS